MRPLLSIPSRNSHLTNLHIALGWNGHDGAMCVSPCPFVYPILTIWTAIALAKKPHVIVAYVLAGPLLKSAVADSW